MKWTNGHVATSISFLVMVAFLCLLPVSSDTEDGKLIVDGIFHLSIISFVYINLCPFFPYFVLNYIKSASSLQSIGFVGPGIALIGLISAKSPSIASAWLTLAVGLKSFSHSGFLVNLQVDAVNTLNFNFKLEWMFHFPLTFHFDYLLSGDRSTIFWCTAWYFYLIPYQYLICLI